MFAFLASMLKIFISVVWKEEGGEDKFKNLKRVRKLYFEKRGEILIILTFLKYRLNVRAILVIKLKVPFILKS